MYRCTCTCLTVFCTSRSIVNTTYACTPNISRQVSSYVVLSMFPVVGGATITQVRHCEVIHVSACTCTCTYTHAFIISHAVICAYSHTDTHSYSHTDTRAYSHTDTHSYSHTDTRAYSHTDTCSCSHTDTHSYSHTDTRSYSHTEVRYCTYIVHVHVSTRTSTCIHQLVCRHKFILSCRHTLIQSYCNDFSTFHEVLCHVQKCGIILFNLNISC